MNRLHLFAILILGFLPGLQAQESARCQDAVRLKNGSLFKGEIIVYQPDSLLVLRSWNGIEMRIPLNSIRRITQRCKDQKDFKAINNNAAYSFREKGIYHAVRLAVMPGYGEDEELSIGANLLYSGGKMFNRQLGLGVGVGVEQFGLYEDTHPLCIPLMAELRGYVLRRPYSPFYAVQAGWAFPVRRIAPKDEEFFPDVKWYGGWTAKAQLGMRLGNHATIHLGLNLQWLRQTQQSFWWGDNIVEYQFLRQRIEMGVGFLL